MILHIKDHLRKVNTIDAGEKNLIFAIVQRFKSYVQGDVSLGSL